MRLHVLLAIVVLLVVALVVASACNTSTPGSSNPTNTRATADGVHASRAALVYAAVIRQLVTKDAGFGGAPSPYRHMYVLDGVVPSAADPMRVVERPAKPFAEDLSLQLAAALQPASVTLVRSRRLAITGAGLGHVIHRGVLITLGRIEWIDSKTAQVANNRWASGLYGQWLTYTVRYSHLSWRVTGISGNKAAIS